MTDYINSFFTKKLYVFICIFSQIPLLIFGFYATGQIYAIYTGFGALLIGFIPFCVCVYASNHLDWDKNCAGCESRNLECLETQIHSFYEKTNKDGSPDKRYKDNRLMGYLNSTYTCIDCNAETLFSSKTSSKPSKKTKVDTVTLIKDGSERKTKDDNNSLNTDIPSEPSNVIQWIKFIIAWIFFFSLMQYILY